MCALRGIKPKAVTKRMKALFYGPAGVGKTTAAIQFPRPYLMDTEKGAENDQYAKMLDSKGGAYFGTSDFDDMLVEVKSLLTEEHPYQTLIIDPLTTVYNDLLDKAALKVGTEFGRHYGEANKSMKHLMNMLVRLDMNVIITSHARVEYGPGMVAMGQTFDCWKKLDYLFDLVFELARRGKDRVGVVRKTRVESLPEASTFPWSYDHIADLYGRSVLERNATPQVLATEEQVAELSRLVDLIKLDPKTVSRWLTKAQAETFAEMPADAAAKCIAWCEEEIAGKHKKPAAGQRVVENEESEVSGVPAEAGV